MRQFLLTAIIASSFVMVDTSSSTAFPKQDKFPACNSEKVIKTIGKRFNKTEKIYWEKRGLVLNTVQKPHLHTDNAFPASPIKRRYCHGDAIFENGKKRRIHYLIEKGTGFAGFTWNVEYCIHGLDPWNYYDGNCQVLSQ